MKKPTAKDLQNFEEDIANAFEQKLIKAPIHLRGGNEAKLINIFDKYQIGDDDWVCCTWASHLECLLKGVPADKLKERILSGQSISLCFPEHKIISSAIVGGIIPIACGLALAEKLKQGKGRVFCFVGDMSAMTGQFWESFHYNINFELPLYFVVANNGKSVCTPTLESWGLKTREINIDGLPKQYSLQELPHFMIAHNPEYKVIYYQYENTWPHSGGRSRVNF